MQNFVHLHVHSQYSILDGQASIARLVDKAMADGMPGIALTDHGNMFGVKEFYNYVKKQNCKKRDKIKGLKKLLASLESLMAEHADMAAYLADRKMELLKMDTHTDSSPEAAVAHSKLRNHVEQVEAMDKEFGFSPATAREKIAKLEAVPDFKPIIGCEVYVARRALHLKDKAHKEDQSGYHLILLAKNEKGYHNLIKIVSKAWTEGFYQRPRTDRTELEKYHEGLICCSACLGGEIPKRITNEQMAEAEEAVQWYKRVFGDDYYLELQLHKATVARANHEAYTMQLKVNEQLKKLSAKYGIKLICSNDVHFVDEENAEAHDRLICLSTSKDLDDPKRMLYSKQEWLKTREEMAKIFGDVPEAMANTVDICNQVEHYSIDHAPIMPTFAIPEEFGTEEEYRSRLTEKDLFDEFTRDENGNVVMSEEDAHKKIERLGGYDKLYRIKFEADYLAHLTFIGAKKRYGDPLSEEVRERLVFELHIMKTMGFPGYFLIVQDFITAAREQLDVSVGPGRGSAAGSAVAYCLGITQIDPIAYDLLFERFLNPDRISLPDIDIDFDDDGRGRVLNWVTQKYGKEKVAHIITYGTMATKSAIKDVARVQKLPLDDSNRLCKLVPEKTPEGKKVKNLAHAIELVPELKEAEQSTDPIMHDTIEYAKMLEGNVRNTGVHACGTIICRDDITDWVPVSTADDKETGEKMLVTQYEGSVIEDTGLIKMDFLGLKTLSIIKDAVENVFYTRGKKVDIDDFSIINDPVTYKLYCEGRTVGTFQFESGGMQKYLRELQPSTFEDLIAMNALYRPGPMDYIPQFIARKHGDEPIVYDIPIMEKYLKDTYGITVYQEQVMLLSRLLGGFTRGESDTLRKAMGKKLKDKLDELKPKFITGGQKNGHDPKVLEKIWADWEKFASYAFNKSHATCYSWVAFQTAYLKANYPPEFMAAVLSRNLSNIEQITLYMGECKRMGINVLGPDVNKSFHNFSADADGNVRFGLAAIKGVGEAAVKSIIDERRVNGEYKDIYDFMERVNFSAVNSKCIENMAYAGAFDSLIDFHRSKLTAQDLRSREGDTMIQQLIRYGSKFQADRQSSMQSLFGGMGLAVEIARPGVPVCQEASQIETLKKEREVVGLYLSAHPLDDYKYILDNMCTAQLDDLKDVANSQPRDVSFGGMVIEATHLTSKQGRPYGRFKLEAYTGETHEFSLFGREYENLRKYMYNDYMIYAKGKIQPRRFQSKENIARGRTEMELVINSIMQMHEVEEHIREMYITLRVNELTDTLMRDLVEAVKKSKGKTTLRIKVADVEGDVSVQMYSKTYKVLPRDLIAFCKDNDIKYHIK
ncbi:MAG: DNA polymerase III subunit alpha [Rikenellaceae bacterium]|nr:DNA polymerase III subunit alpha [Rikenellaceae bacterium]